MSQKKFLPIINDLGRPPWGYMECKDNPDIFLPVQSELEFLDHAKRKLLPHYSYRKVAEWLTKVTGRYISDKGLKARLVAEEKNASEEKYYRNLKKKLEEANRKYERYANKVGGTSNYIWQQ